MPLTTAELAQKKKFLVDAILWKKIHPSARFYQDIYSYNGFVFKQALRFLPRDYTKHLQYAVNEFGEETGGFSEESATKFVDEVYRNKDGKTIRELLDPATTPLEPEKAIEEFEQAKTEQEEEAEKKKKEKKDKEKENAPEGGEQEPAEPEQEEPEEEEPKEESEEPAETNAAPVEEPAAPPIGNTVEVLPGLENTQPISLEPPVQETGGTTGPTSQPLQNGSKAWIENLERPPVAIPVPEESTPASGQKKEKFGEIDTEPQQSSKKLEEQSREAVNTPAESPRPPGATEQSASPQSTEPAKPEPAVQPEPTAAQKPEAAVAILEKPSQKEPQPQAAPRIEVPEKEALVPLLLTPPVGETGGRSAPPSKADLEADRMMWMANLEPGPKVAPTPEEPKEKKELGPKTPPKPKFVMIGSRAFETKPAKVQPQERPVSFTKREVEKLNQVAQTNKEILERKTQVQPQPKVVERATEPAPTVELEKPKVFPRAMSIIKRLPIPSSVKNVGNNLLIAAHKVAHRVPAAITASTTGGLGLGLIAGGLPGGVIGGLMGYVISSYLIRDTTITTYTTQEIYEEQEEPYYHPSVTSDGSAMIRKNSLGRNLAKQGVKRLAKQGAKKVASSLAKKALAEGVKEGLTALAAATSEVWGPVLLIIGAILFLLIFGPKLASLMSLCPPDSANPFLQPITQIDSSGNITIKKPQIFNHCGAPQGGGGGNKGTTPTATIDIKKTAPAAVDNGQNIPYQITVTNNGGSAVDIDVTDPIPNNTQYVDASDLAGNVNGAITWHLTGLAPGASKTVTLTVKPLLNDVYITNQASATISSGGGGSGSGTNTGGNPGTGGTNQGGSSGNNTPANNNNCSGNYGLNNPIGNFGDPNCNFNKSDLFQALQQADPANAAYWFNVVIPCESGYNPNSYNPNSTDGDGAFGLTQMGRGQNGQYDHGDVNWPLQASNSVNYQHQLNGWTYWACAIDRW